MLDSGDWTAIGTGALAAGTFVLAWVTVKTGAKERRHDDEKRAEDRARDDRLRRESFEQLEHAQFERLIAEALSAAEDMSAAVKRFAVYRGMQMVADSAKNAELVLAPPPWFQDETIPLYRRIVGMVVIALGHFSAKPTDIRYLQTIFPAVQHLRAVLMPLRLGRDPKITESATRLAAAAESRSVSSSREYEHEWKEALAEFRSVALDRLNVRQNSRNDESQ
jgi:hypothetical protein